MAICTLTGHVSRALDFYNKSLDSSGLYFAIAHPDTWTSGELGARFVEGTNYDTNPPVPLNTDNLINTLGFKKAEASYLVVPDNAGALEYRATKWKIVSAENAVAQGARWVYVSTYLYYTELSTSLIYRQVGLYSGLTRAEGVSETKYALVPSEVASPGLLEAIDYRKPVYRSADMRESIKIIIEF